MSASRLQARQRLTAVLAEQKERDAAESATAEQAKQTQLAHILALKLSLQHNNALHAAQHAAAVKQRRQHAVQQRDERRQLEASGVNADGVFLAREEAERRRRETARQRKADTEAQQRIEANIRRETDERIERDKREEERRAVKERLRQKVSRNVIEVTALQLAQQQQRAQRRAERRAQRLLEQQQQESKESLLPALTADSGGDEEADEDGRAAEQSPHARFLAWQQRHSPSAAVSPIELLHYQRRRHGRLLDAALSGMRDRHAQHERGPIMGRTYHNEPLLAEPRLLHFVDYTPGTAATLPLTITNTSFSFNTIQPQPQPPGSALSLVYVPAGRLSSGQSFTLSATYKSDGAADESGAVDFVAESGAFRVEWRASRRRAAVSVEAAEVALECVRGERQRRAWRMRNDGAVPVRWAVRVQRVQGRWREEEEEEEAAVRGEGGDEAVDAVERAMATSGFPMRMALEGELPGYSQQQVSIAFHPVLAASLTLDCVVTFSPLTSAAVETSEASTAETLPATSDSSAPTAEISASDPTSSPAAASTEPQASTPDAASSAPSPVLASFPLCLVGVSHDLPLHLADATLRLGTVCSGRLYRSALHIHNRSAAPHRFALHCPQPLRSVVAFSPAVGFVQPGGEAVVGVRVEVARGEEERVWREARRLSREANRAEAGAEEGEEDAERLEHERTKLAIDVPLTVEVSGQTLPLHWNLRARLTTSVLSLSASALSFPPTRIGQASALPLTLTNHSPLLQKVHLSAPPGFAAAFTPAVVPPSAAHPSHCFINLLPLRSFSVCVLFAPAAAAGYDGRLLLRSDAGDEYRLRVEGRGEEGGLAVEGGGEARLPATTDGDSERLTVQLRNDDTDEVEVEVRIPEGAVRGQRSESSFLSVQPRVLRLAPRERRRLELTFAPNVAAQAAEETAATSRLSVLTEEPEGSGAATSRSAAGRPSKASAAAAAPADAKKKGKKLSAEEQKRADEEARRVEAERAAREVEEQRARAEEERRREAERVWNSPEAVRERELEHPSNKLAGDCAVQWSAQERGEPWSRHARHRVAIYYRSTKAVAAAQAAAAAASAALIETVAEGASEPTASPPPAVAPAVVTVAPRVTYLTLHTCIVQPTLLLEPAALSFGRIAVGERCRRSVRVTNASDAAVSVTVDHFGLASPFRLLSPPPLLPPLQSATLTFVFEPSAAARSRAGVYVRSATTRSLLAVEGESFLPSFTVSAARLHAGHCLPGGSSSRQLTVTNTSSSALPLPLRLCGWQPQLLPCPFAVPVSSLLLQPGAPHPLVMRFAPQQEGRYSCRLRLAEREEVELTGSCSDWAVAVEVDGASGEAAEGEAEGAGVWNVLRRVEESMAFDVRSRVSTADSAAPNTARSKAAKDKEPKDKAAKPARGGRDAQLAAATPAALLNEAVYVPLKSTLYDALCADPQPRVVVLDCDESDGARLCRAFRLCTSSAADSTATASSATVEWSVTQRDVLDNFFAVEPAAASVAVKAGEEARGSFVFARQRYDEWRKGKGVELLGHELGGGGWVESEVRCVMKVGGGGGGKNEAPAATRTESFILRAFVE